MSARHSKNAQRQALEIALQVAEERRAQLTDPDDREAKDLEIAQLRWKIAVLKR
jgi:hypothetical protein